MLRKILLIVMAVLMSFGLTVLGGYFLYVTSGTRSELSLSFATRFVVSPLIAMLVGTMVGLLSKDHPVATSMLGLGPWAVMDIMIPQTPALVSGWIVRLTMAFLYLSLNAAAAAWIWSHRARATSS